MAIYWWEMSEKVIGSFTQNVLLIVAWTAMSPMRFFCFVLPPSSTTQFVWLSIHTCDTQPKNEDESQPIPEIVNFLLATWVVGFIILMHQLVFDH